MWRAGRSYEYQHALDHDLVAGADAEREPAAGRRLHRERLGCKHDRVARVGRHDRRHQLDLRHPVAHNCKEREGVVGEYL